MCPCHVAATLIGQLKTNEANSEYFKCFLAEDALDKIITGVLANRILVLQDAAVKQGYVLGCPT